MSAGLSWSGAQQAVVKTFGVGTGLEFFGFLHEVAAPVAVDAPWGAGAVAVGEGDRPLEHVVLRGRGVGFSHTQQTAQFHDKGLSGGQFARGDSLPALDEGPRCVDVLHGGP